MDSTKCSCRSCVYSLSRRDAASKCGIWSKDFLLPFTSVFVSLTKSAGWGVWRQEFWRERKAELLETLKVTRVQQLQHWAAPRAGLVVGRGAGAPGRASLAFSSGAPSCRHIFHIIEQQLTRERDGLRYFGSDIGSPACHRIRAIGIQAIPSALIYKPAYARSCR
jgi:hypothetical protein